MDLEQKSRLRAIARIRAAEYSNALGVAANEGKNAHLESIDLQDREEEFTRTLPEADRDPYTTLFAQELNALTQATLDQVDKLNAETAQQQIESSSNAIGIVVGIVVLLLLLALAAR